MTQEVKQQYSSLEKNQELYATYDVGQEKLI